MNDVHLRTWAAVGLVYVIATSTMAMLFSAWLFLTRPSVTNLQERVTLLEARRGTSRVDSLSTIIDSLRSDVDSLDVVIRSLRRAEED